jgi:hypothetical protein
MTKKTEQHKIYARLAEALSLRLAKLANKVFGGWVNSLTAPKVAPIACSRQKRSVTYIQNLRIGKLKRAMLG